MQLTEEAQRCNVKRLIEIRPILRRRVGAQSGRRGVQARRTEILRTQAVAIGRTQQTEQFAGLGAQSTLRAPDGGTRRARIHRSREYGLGTERSARQGPGARILRERDNGEEEQTRGERFAHAAIMREP